MRQGIYLKSYFGINRRIYTKYYSEKSMLLELYCAIIMVNNVIGIMPIKMLLIFSVYYLETDKLGVKEDIRLNPYLECPTITTKSFTIRLIRKSDSESLFECYNDKTAVQLMNDDNCDFGFYVESQEKMLQTIGYWLDFYKKQCFIRFSIVDNATGVAVGTIEGFGGETGVLRVDISSAYERASYLSEIFNFARDNFHEIFGNEYLVTKAISNAVERRQSLICNAWEYIDTFKKYQDYYKIRVNV